MKKLFLGAIFGLALCSQAIPQANPDMYDAASLTIATGGTSQQVFGPNASRRALLIQNPNTATEPLFCNFGAAASLTLGNSFSLAAGQSFYQSQPNFVTKSSVNCNATTTSHAFTAKEG
jgi:hypothetical protein